MAAAACHHGLRARSAGLRARELERPAQHEHLDVQSGALRSASMAWDDDDWPEPERDPEALERRRAAMHSNADLRRRALRWAYAGLGILLIVVILIAALR